MNKSELIDAIVAKTGMTKYNAKLSVNAMMEIIVDTVAAGDTVQLVDFGTFKEIERSERKARNPLTGEEIIVSAKKHPKFVAGKHFKEKVAGV